MPTPSKELIQKLKDILEKKTGKEVSWQEASEGAYNLLRLADLLVDLAIKDKQRQNKLKENPKGFYLEGAGYTCFICSQSISDKQAWYDKYGIKCPICQKAIDKKIIPASAAKHKDGWYSKYDLENCFNINKRLLTQFVKQGILKPRIVPSQTGRSHVQIFLIKDNKDILPPKKLTESHMIKETIDGKDWYHSEPWYKFVDPLKHLKGYKIMDYLKVTHSEESKKSSQKI